MLRVGASLSITGPFSVMGKQARAAIELWVDEVNRGGGIAIPPEEEKRFPLSVILDDRGRRGEAARNTEKLIRDEGVEILLGPYSSALTLAAAPVAESYEVPLWNHGGSADALYERGFHFIIGLVPPASTYFRGVFEWARAVGCSGGRVALVHGARGGFPAAVAGGALRWAAGEGFEVVWKEPYPSSPAGFARLAADLRRLQPDLILGAGRFGEDAAFARVLREASLDPRAVALVAAGVSAFREALGSDAEGFVGPSQWEVDGGHPPDLGPTSEEFARRLAARSGFSADYPAAQAYAACVIAMRCLQLAGRGDSARIREVASSLRCTTFFGPFRIESQTGRPIGLSAPLLVQWKGGRREIVWSPARRS
ncbi:MAG: amino acid ABC transporter substrate-binding protein [Nitrospinota bacterium]